MITPNITIKIIASTEAKTSFSVFGNGSFRGCHSTFPGATTQECIKAFVESSMLNNSYNENRWLRGLA